jgi:hypothetical protein
MALRFEVVQSSSSGLVALVLGLVAQSRRFDALLDAVPTEPAPLSARAPAGLSPRRQGVVYGVLGAIALRIRLKQSLPELTEANAPVPDVEPPARNVFARESVPPRDLLR